MNTNSTTESPKPVIDIFVRLGAGGNEGQREISFGIPEGIDPMELLDRGFALDGNEAAATVCSTFHLNEEPGYFGPFETVGASLTDALADTQRALIKYLRERGFEPRFA